MKTIREVIPDNCKRAAVAGHSNPDGDCIGSCTALYLYLRKYFPEISVDLFLEMPREGMRVFEGLQDARTEDIPDSRYDLFLLCDTSSEDRIGVAGGSFARAGLRVVIDHHESNTGFADVNHVVPGAASCAEVLMELLDYGKLDRAMATSLYLGIVHDCGAFQYQNTTPDTMRRAALLMEKGVDFTEMIHRTLNERTFNENRVTGYALSKAELLFGGKLAFSMLTAEERERFGVTTKELGLIVSDLNLTAGIEAALFLYEKKEGLFKASFRSRGRLNVMEICVLLGGGGHLRAAGCDVPGSAEEVRELVLRMVGERI